MSIDTSTERCADFAARDYVSVETERLIMALAAERDKWARLRGFPAQLSRAQYLHLAGAQDYEAVCCAHIALLSAIDDDLENYLDFLWREYAMEDDAKLTSGAKALKRSLINFVTTKAKELTNAD